MHSVIKLNFFTEILLRCGIFAYVLCAYLYGADLTLALDDNSPIAVIIWCVLMLGMIMQIVPFKNNGVSNNKQFSKLYVEPRNGYDPAALAQKTRLTNRRAIGVLIFWLTLNAAAAVLYLNRIIDGSGIIMLVMVYYLCDALCIAIWCPIQKLFMHSHCCADCRIYGWGYFLVFGSLILLPNFYTLSLVALSLILLVRWEVRFKLYPERFFPYSNAAINCKMCTVPKCRVANRLLSAAKKIGRA